VARFLMIAYTTYVHDGRVRRHAEALVERGDHVDVLCLDSGHNGLHAGVNVFGMPMPRYRGGRRLSYVRSYLWFFGMAAWKTLRLSLKQRYDAVIVCTMPDAAVLCALPARLFGSKVLLDVHDTMPELYREKFGGRRGAVGARLLMLEERTSARLADAVLAVHKPHRARLIEAGVPADKVWTVMNAPDPAIFQTSTNSRSGDDTGPFMLVSHGTMARRCGLDVAIEAAALARRKIPGLRMTLIGRGDFVDEAKRLVTHLSLHECVRFIDEVPVEQLPRLLSAASVGLVPYRASSATHLMLPVKLLDYAALGIPTIAARLLTLEHYFDDSAVRFFEPGDAAQLADAIEELYRHPERRTELARNARRVLERIGWPVQRVEYCRAVDSLLGTQSSIVRATAPITQEETKWSVGRH
jgi:glycosyltransferase involved in cell wall biosynthesis